MTTRRFYANAAPQQTLANTITSGATSCQVAGSFAAWPVQFPFFAALDLGTASMEIVSVTAIVGTTATIVRGQDGTSAIGHPAGATMDQVFVRQDMDEANAHTSSSAGVHGISGNVVGHNDTQTLSNKTLSSPILTGTATGAGVLNTTGAMTTTAAITGGTVAASGNGTVTGVHVPKSYTTEAAATVALPSPAVGTTIWLTAPAVSTNTPGLFSWSGSAWLPVTVNPRMQATQTTGIGQSLPSGSTTTLTGFGVDIDTFGGGSFVPSTGIWTCPAAGNYEISAMATVTSGGTRIIGFILKNGTSTYGVAATGTTVTVASVALPPKEFALAQGDTIAFAVNVNAASIVTIGTSGETPFFRIKRIL